MKKKNLLAAILLAGAISLTAGIAGCEIKGVDKDNGNNQGQQQTTEYKVTFNANGHGSAPAQATTKDGKVARPADPAEEGWTFGGWYKEAECVNAFDFSAALTADITLYAKWTEKTGGEQPVTEYKVTFNANGHGSAPAQATTKDGKVARPADPAEEGWTFGGWYKEAECVNAFDFSAALTADITLYAKWTEKTAGVIGVSGVIVSETSKVVTVGADFTLTAAVTPAGATDKSVAWSSSDDTVAEVDNAGHVTVKKAGTATITVTTTDGGHAASCALTVQEQAAAVESITLDYATTEQKVGAEFNITATVAPAGTAVVWSSSDSSVAVVTAGRVRILKPGVVTITAKAGDKSAQCVITVKSDAVVDAEILYSAGNYESAAFEWKDANAHLARVEYKLHGAASYTLADGELIRQKSSTEARVDIPGLKGGELYDFKITASEGKTLTAESIAIQAYDRSGYAHFKYTSGVGAYNDDGTLKDNAIVIYVTDKNKDTVMRDVVAKYEGVAGYEGLKMFKIPYCAESEVKTNWNKQAEGIGWWLNNNQYTTNNAASSKNKSPSNTYDATNGGKLGFKSVNNPIVVRIIGSVSTPEGLTAFDSVGEGGGVGDNGHMARIKNLKNITIEGIGEDATMLGWGVHFVKGTDATGGQGESFEVRNITFSQYPEDAIGMEGQQAGGKLTASVERCWIHNNTFLPGRCDNPAESDKKEGDGSCDFKRGMYFTCSYNWFEYCHKTNLVGSSDDSLQYNLTYHHNVWYQCGSRIPLTRQANVHFYNNYVWGDATEKTTPYAWISKPALSYVHSLRANCYIYSEGNYYDGCKNVTDGKSGGDCKGFNNMFYACFGTNTITAVSDREQVVDSKCAYNGVSYKAFDTNPNLFYYDTGAKRSDCYLTDPVTARADCLRYSGVLKHGYDDIDTRISDARPDTALNVTGTLTIDLTKAAMGGSVSGVKFINAKSNAGTAKGKGLLAVFTVAARTDITVSSGEVGDQALELVNADGTVVAGKITTFTGTLEKGTYIITAGQKDKEGSISKLTFACGVSDAEKIADVVRAIDAIGTVAYTAECANRIDTAKSAYYALSADLKAQVTNAAALTSAIASYDTLAAATVTDMIDAIGTVGADSGVKISAARNAYSKLTPEQRDKVSNYQTLVTAEETYIRYEVQGVQAAIAKLAATSTAATEQQIRDLLAEYEAVEDMYEALDDEKKGSVTGYGKVTEGIEALNGALKPYDVRDAIAALPDKADVKLADAGAVAEARRAYDALTDAQKAIVGDINRLIDAELEIAAMRSKTTVAIFARDDKNSPLTLPACVTAVGAYKDNTTFTYDGETYSDPLKMESSTVVTITLTKKSKVTLKFTGAMGHVVIDDCGKKDEGHTADADGVLVITLEAGTHTVKKGNGSNPLCYIIIEDAE